MEISHTVRGVRAIEVPAVRSTERALCQLCGDEIATANGGRHTGLVFLAFERLLDMHMEQRHSNICVLPTPGECPKAA